MRARPSAKWPMGKTEALGRCHPLRRAAEHQRLPPFASRFCFSRSNAAQGFEPGPGWALSSRWGLGGARRSAEHQTGRRPQTGPKAGPEATATLWRPRGSPDPTPAHSHVPTFTFLSLSIKTLLLPLESRFRFFSSARRSITRRSLRRRVPVSDEAELRAAAPAAPESPRPERVSAIPGTLAPPPTSHRTRLVLSRLLAQNGAACQRTAPAAPARLVSAQAHLAQDRRSRSRLHMRGEGSGEMCAGALRLTGLPPRRAGTHACCSYSACAL